MDFQDLLEPIELIEPLAVGSELAEQPVLKCDKGYVCATGTIEL